MHTKFHGDLVCHFDVQVSALQQDCRKITDFTLYGAFVLHFIVQSIQPHLVGA